MTYLVTEEEFEDLITSYDFITKMNFTTKEQVKVAMEYCQSRDRLTTDIADYLLDLLNTLSEHELETTESYKDWKTAGISAN
jgi:hypothetical protein